MSNLLITPGPIGGTVAAPPSKSAAHRALICAALSRHVRAVSPISCSADMEATLSALDAMGFPSCRRWEQVTFLGYTRPEGVKEINCRESGSTLRFLLPLAAALGMKALFTGEGRLPQRPMDALTEQLTAHGVTFSAPQMPFEIGGFMKPGLYTLPGDVSSQFVSGLLLALPLLAGDSEIRLTSPLQSGAYVDMTLDALKHAGIRIERVPTGYLVPGGQQYTPKDYAVEGDWSNGAFWLCAGTLFSEQGVTVTGLDPDCAQGDRAVLEILRRFGASPILSEGGITVQKTALRGCAIDAGEIPDLVPILAVTAAFAKGHTEIYNAARLRIKESDRISSVAALLRDMGGVVDEGEDRLVIHGGRQLTGGDVDSVNDHRVAMSATVAALGCSGPVALYGAGAVNKSYPDFFKDFESLGGKQYVL